MLGFRRVAWAGSTALTGKTHLKAEPKAGPSLYSKLELQKKGTEFWIPKPKFPLCPCKNVFHISLPLASPKLHPSSSHCCPALRLQSWENMFPIESAEPWRGHGTFHTCYRVCPVTARGPLHQPHMNSTLSSWLT